MAGFPLQGAREGIWSIEMIQPSPISLWPTLECQDSRCVKANVHDESDYLVKSFPTSIALFDLVIREDGTDQFRFANESGAKGLAELRCQSFQPWLKCTAKNITLIITKRQLYRICELA